MDVGVISTQLLCSEETFESCFNSARLLEVQLQDREGLLGDGLVFHVGTLDHVFFFPVEKITVDLLLWGALQLLFQAVIEEKLEL